MAWLNTDEEPFALLDVSILVVAADAERYNPDLYSVSGLQEAFAGPGPPVRTLPSHPFANSVVTVSSAFPAAGLIEVPHELGHAHVQPV